MEPFNRNQEEMQQQISGSISQGQQVPPFNQHPIVMIPTPSSISTAVVEPNRSQPIVIVTSSGTSNPSPAMSNLPASACRADPNQMVPSFNPHPLVIMPSPSSISTAVLEPNRSQTIVTGTSSGTSNPSPAMINLPTSTSRASPNQMVPSFNPHPLVLMPTPSSISTAVLQPNRSQTIVTGNNSGTLNPSPAMTKLPASTSSADPNQMVTPFDPHPLVMMPTPSNISTAVLQTNRSQTLVTGASPGTSNPSPAMINLPASTSSTDPNQMVTPFNPHPLVMMPTPRNISTAVLQPNRTSQTIVTGTSSGTLNPSPAMINLPASTSKAHPNQMVSSPYGSYGLHALTPTTSRPHTHQNVSSTRFNPHRDQRFFSTRLGPQIVSNVNSTSLSCPTNPQDTFNKGKHAAVPLASISRPQEYMASTSNNTSGNRYLDSVGPPQTNALTAGLSAISTAAFNAAPTFQSIFRASSQQNTLTDAVTQLEQMLDPTGSIYHHTTVNKVPSIYEQQLQKYLFYWNKRPSDNNNVFWRQFVAEFFAPDSKRKLCLSACQDQLTTKYRRFSKDNSPCGHCRTHSRYGYDIPFEELPIYFQYKFKSLTDETLMLGAFQEHQVDNDNIVLYFPRVVEQSLYDECWIVREGPLAIIFTADRKILSWQFCMRHCETLAHRRALISQVSEILRNAGVSSASGGSDQQAVQKNSDKIIKIGCDLANKLEENMGLRPQHAGTYMINDASNCMKDSTDFNSCKQQRKDCTYNYAAQEASGHNLHNQLIGSGSNQQVNLQVPKPSNPLLNPPNQLNTRASGVEHMTSSSASPPASTDDVLNDHQQVNLQVPKPSNPLSNPPNQLNTRASGVEHMTSSSASPPASTDDVLNDLNTDDFFKASGHNLYNQLIGSGSNQQVNLQVPEPSNPLSNPPNQLNTRASGVEHMTNSSASPPARRDYVLNDVNTDDFFNDFFDGIDFDNYQIDSSNIDDDLLKYM